MSILDLSPSLILLTFHLGLFAQNIMLVELFCLPLKYFINETVLCGSEYEVWYVIVYLLLTKDILLRWGDRTIGYN